MSSDTAQHYALLDDLDARQNQVIAELDELNTKIDSVLESCTKLHVLPEMAENELPAVSPSTAEQM